MRRRNANRTKYYEREQIKAAMSNVSLKLGNVRPPEWATAVPESEWIAELLRRVREKNKTTTGEPQSQPEQPKPVEE